MTQTRSQISAVSTAPPASASRRSGVLSAMCLALFMTNFDGTAGDMALAQIQSGFGTTMLGVQWFLNAYHLPVASLLLASGKFGDFFGRKKIFLIGLFMFTISSMLCGLAPSFSLLIVGRSLQGIGAAALIPLSLTIVTATFTDEKERTKAIGIWSAVSALAMVVGPGLGGLMIDTLSWRSIFFINVPLGVITLWLTVSSFKEQPPSRENNSLNVPSILLSILTMAALTYLLTQGGVDVTSWQTLAMAGATILSFTLFALSEKLSREPIIPPHLLRNRTFFIICATQMIIFFMSGGLFFILSLFLQHVQGYSATLTGLCFLPMNGAIIAASFASGWVMARRGWRFPILTGLTMVCVSILTLTRIGTDTAYAEILWTLVLAGFGGGLTIPSLAASAMNSVLPSQEGIASAVSSISIQFGGILGIGIQGAIFSHRLAADLGNTLSKLNGGLGLSGEEQSRLAESGMKALTEDAISLPSSLSPALFDTAVRQAFISGLHATLFVAFSALVMGLCAIAFFTPRKIQPSPTHD